MSENKYCPLKALSGDKECDSNCAWNIGTKEEPQCAIAKIASRLSHLANK